MNFVAITCKTLHTTLFLGTFISRKLILRPLLALQRPHGNFTRSHTAVYQFPQLLCMEGNTSQHRNPLSQSLCHHQGPFAPRCFAAANTSESPKTLKRAGWVLSVLKIQRAARTREESLTRAHNVSALMLDFILCSIPAAATHTQDFLAIITFTLTHSFTICACIQQRHFCVAV